VVPRDFIVFNYYLHMKLTYLWSSLSCFTLSC